MKKSIVLFISLLFITAVSALILKNLSDTDDYIKEQNYNLNKAQILASIKNTKDEVVSVIKKYDSNFEEDILPRVNSYIPLKIEDIDLKFKVEKYDKYDVNLLKEKESIKYKKLEDLFIESQVCCFDTFRYIYLEDEDRKKLDSTILDVTNLKQIDDIISKFIKETKDKNINKIKDQLGFLKSSNDTTNLEYYELFIKVDYLNEIAKAYYILNKKDKGVEHFELGFK